MMMKEAEKNKKAKKTKAAWQKTLEDDATAFQYDEIYDKMEEKKAATEAKAEEAKKDRAKKPKYINALLETAKKKKLHDELREERQAQKEREEEGEEYSDKDKFVTGVRAAIHYPPAFSQHERESTRERERESEKDSERERAKILMGGATTTGPPIMVTATSFLLQCQ